jgi:lysine-N-methylase
MLRFERMLNEHTVRQPKYFDAFRCIGADCEDTCCSGWGVLVDRDTWDKYQNLPGSRIKGKLLTGIVEINPAGSSAVNYARFRMEGPVCPALEDGLCSIQKALGESNIPDLCSTFPRVLNAVGGVMEKSLHLSCPEAARLVLNDPEAMIVDERPEDGASVRSGAVGFMEGDSDQRLNRIRSRMIGWIQQRSLPLWQRITVLGFAIDRLAGVDLSIAESVLEDYLRHLTADSFAEIFQTQKTDPAHRLETVLDLVVGRISSDYTVPRFLECYRDFMLGLAWTPECSMEQLAARYAFAAEKHLRPFLQRHEHLLENYVANYIFRTVFPYRSRLPGKKLEVDCSRESMKHSFVLLSVHYAMVRTLLTGMAALYKDELHVDHAVKLVQSYSKAFLHSTAFEGAAVEHLAKNAGDSSLRLYQLVMD